MNKRAFLSETPCRYDFLAEAAGEPTAVCVRTCPWSSGKACREPNAICLMQASIQCAKNAIEKRTTLFTQVRKLMEQIGFQEIKRYSGVFTPGALNSRKFIWLDDDNAPKIIVDVTAVPKLIATYAGIAMSGNADSDFNSLIAKSMRPTASGPALSLASLQSNEGRFGYNGGQGCDVLDGPCSCGAWHHSDRLI